MKTPCFIALFVSLVSFCGIPALAADRLMPADEVPLVPARDKIASFHLDLGSVGRLFLVEGEREGAIGHFDEIVLEVGHGRTTVLKTEGRRLIDAVVGSFTSPTAHDVVLVLDTGGAGGFVDLVLLGVVDGKVVVLHEEEAVKGGRAEFVDRTGDGRPDLLIHRLVEDMATNQVKQVTEVWTFTAGKVTALPGTE